VGVFRIFSEDWFQKNPLRVFSLVLIVVIASVVAVHAYWRLSSPQAGPRVSVTSLPLEFSMELNKAEFQPGENVTIKLSLKNIGNKTITLSWYEYYAYYDALMYFDFYIIDANGTLVYQWTKDHAALLAVLKRTLSPGEQLTSVYPWYQLNGYPNEAQVPAGTYTVRGSTRKVGLTVEDQTAAITLETPTITFIIK